MLISVPQYIDIEDKIVGPLTAKQLGWLISMGIILIILWNVLSKPMFFILGIPTALLFIALAFYKPYGVPLGNFIIFGIMYFFRPKIYFWKRTPQKEVHVVQKNKVVEKNYKNKQLTAESLRELSQLLDSEGRQYSEGLEEILKKAPTKK